MGAVQAGREGVLQALRADVAYREDWMTLSGPNPYEGTSV